MPTDSDETTLDLGVVRDQGQRPTCLSFALSDVHQAAICHFDRLSPECLHRTAATLSRTPVTSAMPVSAALRALECEGQTTEADWPYHTESCVKDNPTYFRKAGQERRLAADEIFSRLNDGLPVVLILNIGIEFFSCSKNSILEYDRATPSEACHAVVIIGARRIDNRDYFLLRNSWGSAWGNDGNVWASLKYIADRSPLILDMG